MRTPTLAVIGAAVVLTLGAAGGGYAAGMITGGDIKDGTVASPDVKDDSLKLKDLAPGTIDNLAPRVVISRKGPGSYLPASGDNTVFHTMSVPRGEWLVSVTATAFPQAFGDPAIVLCSLRAPGSSIGQTSASIDSDYAALATQITVNVNTSADVAASFECSGDNAGVNEVTITALEVSKITDRSP